VKAAAAAVVIALAPNPAHFGDLVHAHITGNASRASFAPFAVRSHHGADYVLQCLDPLCVPGPGSIVVAPRRLHAVVAPRTSTAQVQRPVRSFRRESSVRAPTYRIAPARLRLLLLALAVLLVAVALAVAWPLLRALVPARVDERTPLERALDLVRASLGRDAAERRRALDVLGRELASGALADDAFALAWSEPEPEPTRVTSLLDSVRGRA
jgi:hypothetical protein